MHTINHVQTCQKAPAGAIRLRLPSADVLGMIASGVCLIHCLVLPFVLMLLPVYASGFLEDDRTHFFLAFFVATFCLLAVVPGYIKHRNQLVLSSMATG